MSADEKSAVARSYDEKLKEKLSQLERVVAQAESVEGASPAAAADVKADVKADAKADADATAVSPSARAYHDRIRERLAAAARVVATADVVAANAALAATPTAVAMPSMAEARTGTSVASPRSAATAATAARRIVLGPTVRDAVARLARGFEFVLYAMTSEHKAVQRRSYTVWFADRTLCWSAGTAQLLVAAQRVPVSELTHLFFGAQTKVFQFASAALGGAELNAPLCVSLVTPKLTLDLEALSKTDFNQFLACLNTVLESYGKLTFLERGSPTPGVETRRFRIVPAVDLGDDPLQLSAAGTVASTGAAAQHTATVNAGLPNVWLAPSATRLVFPANVGTHGFRAVSGQPLNTDITALSRSAVPFGNPHMFELPGRAAPLRIHLDPAGRTEADAWAGADGTDVLLREDAKPAAAADDLEGDTVLVEDTDSDSDAEDDPVRAPTTAAAAAATTTAAAPAADSVEAQRRAVAALLPPMPVVVKPAASPTPAAATAPKTPKRTDALAGALLQGLVWKAAGVFKRWDSRYVALVGRYLFKYDSPTAPAHATLGHPIPLDLCTFEAAGEIAAHASDPTKGPAFLFRVTYKPPSPDASASAPVREWVLGVSTDAIRTNWLKALAIAKPLIADKVAGRRPWSQADVDANRIAQLAYQSH